MCKYCEQSEEYLGGRDVLWFKREGLFVSKESEDKKVATIVNHKETFNDLTLNKGWIITLANSDEAGDWYDLKINYCPMCGKQLRKDNERVM